jgi:two-component system OmpR family sensor kinase
VPTDLGFTSFRRRLTRSYVLLVTALIAVVGATTTILAFASYIGNVHDAMTQAQVRVRAAASQPPSDIVRAAHGPVHVIVFDRNHHIEAGSSQQRSTGARAVNAIASVFGLHNIHVPVKGGTASIAPDIARFGGFLTWYWSIAFPVGALAILAAWLIGRAITRRAIAPLDEVRLALDRISAGNFEPEPLPRESGELAALTSAYNAVARRLTAASGERRQNELRMRQFIADAGHELRTPLTIIMGYLDVLVAGIVRDDDGVAKIHATMQDESRRMRALIDKLIYLARLEQPEEPLSRRFDLAATVRGVLDELAPLGGERVTSHLAARADVNGNEAELREAVKNAVENALKYAPQSAVNVALECGDGSAVVSVVDRGPGMSERDVEHAFDRFYRGELQEGVTGTGLGLSIAQRAVERAGGTIALRSAHGEGTSVRFSVPLADGAAATDSPEPSAR